MRRFLAVTLLVTLLGLALPAGAAEEVLIYSVKEARAYAVKASLSKEVIEVLSQLCNPETDPYECDESRYNQKPNCPESIEIGPSGKAPKPEPPATDPIKGGAGDGSGGEEPPPQASPVRLNRFLTLGKLSNLGAGILESGGLASELYVDLSGRSEPEAHTESEGFSGNRAAWEERCRGSDAEEPSEDSTEHFMSRSDEGPNTYHLAECFNRSCEFGAGASAEHVRTIVELWEADDKVHGRLRAAVDGLVLADGAVRIDSLISYVEFSSDGTEDGIEWSVSSTASGASLAGQEVALPPGRTVSGPGFSVGLAEPFVNASADGSTLKVVAPGLHFGSTEQASYFGGAEIVASFGMDEPYEFVPGGFGDTGDGGNGGSGSNEIEPLDTGGFGSSAPSAIGLGGGGGNDLVDTGTTEPVTAAPATIRVFEMPTGIGAVPAIVGLGIVGWFLLLSRWLQRFPWGRKMTRLPVLRTVDWIYRAFVKT